MDNIFTLEPSTPVNLDPQELRSIAAKALDGSDEEKESVGSISKAAIEVHIASMERDIKEHAESGYYECAWNFADVDAPIAHVLEVTGEFRKRHRGLMIIVGPRKKVTISWKTRKMG